MHWNLFGSNNWIYIILIGFIVGLLSACALGIAGAALGWYATRWIGYAPAGPGMRFLVALGGSLCLAMLGGAMARMLRRTPR